ncbi:hypothetical protein C8R46DRAFT_1214005 [Mycena filopes]|nr:hypothetical protein C8R46DRAFT_1214005 [Mycena filopes]
MAPDAFEKNQLKKAQSKIRALKRELAIARLATEEQFKITEAGIVRLKEKHARSTAAMLAAQQDRVTQAAEAESRAKAKIELEKKERMEEAVSCGVCLDIMQKPDSLTACGHTFCQDCLFTWFLSRRTCPTCVAVVKDPPNINGAVESAIDGLVASNIVQHNPARPTRPRRRGPYDRIFSYLPGRKSFHPNHLRPIETEAWID